jgi:hypothetical protein
MMELSSGFNSTQHYFKATHSLYAFPLILFVLFPIKVVGRNQIFCFVKKVFNGE